MAKPRQPVRAVFCHVIRKESKALQALPALLQQQRRHKPRRAWPEGDNGRKHSRKPTPAQAGLELAHLDCSFRHAIVAGLQKRRGPTMGTVDRVNRPDAGGQDPAGAAALVRSRWDGLIRRQGKYSAAAAAEIDALVGNYRGPRRHYHTLDHIAALLVLLDRHIEPVNDRDTLMLAILYHDVVYDPTRQDNEEASAIWAAGRLKGLRFPADLVGKVVRCILATRHAQEESAAYDADIALLLDLDLSILAASPDTYRSYALAVRREYAHVPDALYRAGRKRVLESFLARDRIYRSAKLRALWEQPARANLANEAATLA
jgi:predicted metal-dependent HD superfamily phosphohydrolase